ncbi:unnamed protein product [Moneuplotes crassus]|uniref:Uncharacterized protein n=1 Tax=Euplotes crassus TaxID=5936 RepID=A0AAD1XD31_EUPCR|nr:unnamed protein product [Moneuplotes crassus]
MRKILSVISILIFCFCVISIITLYKHMDQFFQVRSRLLIICLSMVSMFFIILHYSAGLAKEYAIVLVIIQEFFKSSSMLYVIYFYIKNATEFVDEERGKKTIAFLKVFFCLFITFFGILMFIWAVLWIGKYITNPPCRDIVWLLYRLITLSLIIFTVFVGIRIQKRVKAKTILLYGYDRRTSKLKEEKIPLHHEITVGSVVESTETHSDLSIGVLANTQQHDSINKTLRHMWVCFAVIIFICLCDCIYNLYWQFVPGFESCDKFTNNPMATAWIFLLIRLISLFLIFFPVIFTFLGWKFVTYVFCWPCKKKKQRDPDEDAEYYSDL